MSQHLIFQTMHSAKSINIILKVCIIRLQRYRDYKFLACGTDSIHLTKEMSLCNKLKFSNSYIFASWWCKPIIFQTYVIRSNRIHSLKKQMSTTSGCKDTRIKKLSLLQELISFPNLKRRTSIILKKQCWDNVLDARWL